MPVRRRLPHGVSNEGPLRGGVALMKRKPPVVRSIGIDCDAQALEAVARDCPVELVHGCVHASLASVQFTGPGCSTSRPRRVHRTSCAGRNFTDRQRIKRKVANRGRRYEALTADERLAVPVGHVGSRSSGPVTVSY